MSPSFHNKQEIEGLVWILKTPVALHTGDQITLYLGLHVMCNCGKNTKQLSLVIQVGQTNEPLFTSK